MNYNDPFICYEEQRTRTTPNQESELDLPPCPVCGGIYIGVCRVGGKDFRWRTRCACGCCTLCKPTRQDSIDAWKALASHKMESLKTDVSNV